MLKTLRGTRLSPSPASRDALCYTPLPCFLVKIFCLAVIVGETRDSGQDLGLAEMAKRREISNRTRTTLGRESGHVPDSRLGLEIGEFSLSTSQDGGCWQSCSGSHGFSRLGNGYRTLIAWNVLGMRF